MELPIQKVCRLLKDIVKSISEEDEVVKELKEIESTLEEVLIDSINRDFVRWLDKNPITIHKRFEWEIKIDGVRLSISIGRSSRDYPVLTISVVPLSEIITKFAQIRDERIRESLSYIEAYTTILNNLEVVSGSLEDVAKRYREMLEEAKKKLREVKERTAKWLVAKNV